MTTTTGGLSQPLARVVGDRTAVKLATLGLDTVADLLHHYPRRYVERGKLVSFAELQLGEHATVFAEVVRCSETRLPRPKGKPLLKTDVIVRDDGGRTMKLTMFNRFGAEKELRAGRRAFFAGKVETFRNEVQLGNPAYRLVDDDEGVVAAEFAGALVAAYPANAKIDTFVIARSVALALDLVDGSDDPVPVDLREAHGLLPLGAALRAIHKPRDWADIGAARKRLAWDEALVLQVVLAQRRAATMAQPSRPRAGRPDGLLAAFDSRTPFTLTDGQREIGDLLGLELAAPHPMHRLLQGEVGSGKTLVALRAMLSVVDSGGQAALLAPTEVLAQQHARSLREMLGPLAMGGQLGEDPLATRIAVLTGSLGAVARRTALLEAASGQAGIVIGTHALLSEGVQFADLGLVVVDEQHRFGVEQREALRAKGDAPHVLVMTATPIPRTVAMTIFGDLEVSTLSELPRGRSPITTHVVPAGGRALNRTWEKVAEEVAAGHRAFVVCPRIGEDPAATGAGAAEDLEELPDEPLDGRRPAAAVEEVLPMLREGPLRGLRVAPLHGRLATEVKEDTMRRFSGGDIEVLVATTVIEVGVDVPEASVMIILDADRFGVSQLHQLRGRVGRGTAPGLCILVTEVDPDSPGGNRLKAVAATQDGFELSEVDLAQRREGDVLGVAQSGTRTSLRMLTLSNRSHADLLAQARTAATALVAQDPDLSRHPALQAAVDAVLDPERADYLEKG
ncbi:MAG: ATP-dependent helicase RecG [Frankiales bacterium]|nr:ATP-dependent helicase RecG [Frankiales bacterium]